jgi:hypothetical protein
MNTSKFIEPIDGSPNSVEDNFTFPYEGRDSSLVQRKCCANDHNDASFLCSRCRVVPYCSRDCQQAHFKEHKADCKQIKAARKRVAAMETALRGGPIAE